MTPRNIALVMSLVLLCLLGFLTISVAVSEGVDFLVVISLVLVALLGLGVLGALTSPPDD